MRARWVCGILAAALLGGASVLMAALSRAREEGAMAAVLQSARAEEHVSYRGEAAFRHGGWQRPMEVWHDAASGRTRLRWGPRFELVVTVRSTDSPDPSTWCLDPAALASAYRAEEGSRCRHLGREARTFRITPRVAGRPTLSLTADAETLLPLEVATYTPEGELFRVAAFRSLEIGPQRVEEGRPSRFAGWCGTPVPPERVAELASFPVFLPDYLPRGFVLKEARQAEEPLPSMRLVYTDGATVFEIRQSPVLTPAQIETILGRRMGAPWVQRTMQWIDRRRHRALVRADGGDGIAVERRCEGSHASYEMRVGSTDVEVIARANFREEDLLSVVRSLRAE